MQHLGVRGCRSAWHQRKGDPRASPALFIHQCASFTTHEPSSGAPGLARLERPVETLCGPPPLCVLREPSLHRSTPRRPRRPRRLIVWSDAHRQHPKGSTCERLQLGPANHSPAAASSGARAEAATEPAQRPATGDRPQRGFCCPKIIRSSDPDSRVAALNLGEDCESPCLLCCVRQRYGLIAIIASGC